MTAFIRLRHRLDFTVLDVRFSTVDHLMVFGRLRLFYTTQWKNWTVYWFLTYLTYALSLSLPVEHGP